MLGTHHATGALRLAQSLWTRFGLALVAAPVLFAPCCSGMRFEVDCIKVTATDLSCSGGVTTGYLEVEVADDENCQLIESSEFITYNNRDGIPGYDPAGGDILVDSLVTDLAQPTSSLTVGSFTSQDSSGTITATHWQIAVGHTGGGQSTNSGKF